MSMKVRVWMAQNKNGEYLCEGNLNPNLSYHLSYPYDCEYLRNDKWLMCRTQWELKEHIRKWHGELRADDAKWPKGSRFGKQARCRPVKMVVTWERESEVKKCR